MKTTLIINPIKFLLISLICGFSYQAVSQCAASFSFSQGPGGSVLFTSTSTGTSLNTHYYWQFGQGNNVATYNTTVSTTFTTNQAYAVTLFVSDSTNNCFANYMDTVNVITAGCNSSITISNYQGSGGNMHFSSSMTSPGATYLWQFGNGATSTAATPVNNYTVGGAYTVTLTTSSANSVCTYTAIKTISVSLANCALTANYTYTIGSNGQVSFSDASSGVNYNATNFWWNFGDGTPTTWGPNKQHTFMSNGNFNVRLIVRDSLPTFCADTIIQTINITNANCLNATNFVMFKDTTQNLTWFAVPNYPGNISNVTWNFGDGSSSTQFYPTHTYSAAGTYTVCLTASVSCGLTNTTCITSAIFRPSGNGGDSGEMITLHVLNPSNPVGLQTFNEPIASVMLFPNPASSEISVELKGIKKGNIVTIQVYDLIGNLVSDNKIQGTSDKQIQSFDVSSYSSGIYLVKIRSGNFNHTEKLVIQK